MKRNLIYFIIFIVLAAGAYFLVIKKPWGTLSVDETAFAVNDTAAIGKIFIADMQGKKIVLERQKNSWLLDQKYPVRGDYMTVLLSTIKRVTVNYPVSQAAMDKVVTELAAHNKKVEIYDRKGKLMKSYFVGGPSLDALGTYMLMEGAKHPYVTTIPGFQGVLETRYSTDEQSVRSMSIYNFKLNEIKEVQVSYSEKPDSSFSIVVLGPDSFVVKNAEGNPLGTGIDKDKLHSYLNLYRFINCEAYVNDLPKKDTVLQTRPFCTVNVITRDSASHAALCYHMPLQQDSPMQYDIKGNPLQYDQDRYFALINSGRDFVIVQRFHFGRLMKSSFYFLQQKKHSI
jgi:hypothetical protein